MKNLIITAVLGISMAMASMAIAGGGDAPKPTITASGKKIWYCQNAGASQSFDPVTVGDNNVVVHIKMVDSQLNQLKGKLEDFGIYMSYFYKDTNKPDEEWSYSYPDEKNYLQVSKVINSNTIEAVLGFSGSDVGQYHLRVWGYNPITKEYLWIDLQDKFCRNAKDEDKSPGYEAIVNTKTNLVSPADNKVQMRE